MNKSMHNTAGQEPKEADNTKAFSPPTGPRFGKKKNGANKALQPTAPAFIPMPAASAPAIPAPSSKSSTPAPSKSAATPFNPSAPAFQPSFSSQTPPSSQQQQPQEARRGSGYFPVIASGTTTPSAAAAARKQSWYMPSISQPVASPISMSTSAPMASPMFTPRRGRRPHTPRMPVNPAVEQLCQAIVHYHSCGCRANGSPTFVCGRRGCEHEKPTHVNIGYLPFACTARWSGNLKADPKAGRGPACRERDPGTIGFQREEDTAVGGKGTRSFNGAAFALEDIPDVIPSDEDDVKGEEDHGVKAFEKWIDELSAVCETYEKEEKEAKKKEEKKSKEKEEREAKEKEEKESKEKGEKESKTMVGEESKAKGEKEAKEQVHQPEAQTVDTQTERPETEKVEARPKKVIMNSVATQTVWPQKVMHTVGVQTDPPARPAIKSTGVQTISPEQREIAVQTEQPTMQSQGTQSVEPIGNNDNACGGDKDFRPICVKPYHPPYDYWDPIKSDNVDGALIDLILDVDYVEEADDEVAPTRKSFDIVINPFTLIHWIL